MFVFNKHSASRSFSETSYNTKLVGSSMGMGTGGGSNFSGGGTFIGTDFSFHLLQDIINYEDQIILDKIYREMYTMDPTIGASVDLLSKLPWSSYSLVGVEDQKILDVYQSSCEELGISNLMRSLQTNKYVLGRSIGTLVFDNNRGIFSDCIIHNPTNAEIIPIPLIGYDPKINIKLDKDFSNFLKSTDKRDLDAISQINPDLVKKLSSGGKIELEPIKTIYISRAELIGCENMSIMSRLLPLWILEKALLRGTIISSSRRQKPIMHIKMGSDDWIPDNEQMSSISQLFANADRDPLGAIIATRNDVDVSDVRPGSDFWRVSDEQEMFTQAKLRALGLNESFLSGDATIGNSDASITMLLENLRTEREDMTVAVCNHKVFLNLAKYHGFRHRTEAELNHHVRYSSNSSHAKRDEVMLKKGILLGNSNTVEASSYIIPHVKWSRELQAKGNSSDLELLKTLSESGIPISTAMLASAAGYRIETILDSYIPDLEFRKKINEYKEQLSKISGKDKKDADADAEDDYEYQASVSTANSILQEPLQQVSTIKTSNNRSKILGYLLAQLPKDTKITKKQAINIANHIATKLL